MRKLLWLGAALAIITAGLIWGADQVTALGPPTPPAGTIATIDKPFTNKTGFTATDLKICFNGEVKGVALVDANDNEINNPGPFSVPPAGIGTTCVTFSGGAPGSVADDATAPTQPAAPATARYRFHLGVTPAKILSQAWSFPPPKADVVFTDPVGGTTELLVSGPDTASSAADASGSSFPYVALAGGLAAAVALAAGGGWYVRRRLLR